MAHTLKHIARVAGAILPLAGAPVAMAEAPGPTYSPGNRLTHCGDVGNLGQLCVKPVRSFQGGGEADVSLNNSQPQRISFMKVADGRFCTFWTFPHQQTPVQLCFGPSSGGLKGAAASTCWTVTLAGRDAGELCPDQKPMTVTPHVEYREPAPLPYYRDTYPRYVEPIPTWGWGSPTVIIRRKENHIFHHYHPSNPVAPLTKPSTEGRGKGGWHEGHSSTGMTSPVYRRGEGFAGKSHGYSGHSQPYGSRGSAGAVRGGGRGR